MNRRFLELVFTPAVEAEQARQGSRAGYAAALGAADGGSAVDVLGEREVAFIEARDSFYLASVSATGWPYVQHRGGPPGFVRRIEGQTIGWADYAGNRQYVSVGNSATDDRVALIFMDYPHRRRLKVLGHLRVHDLADRPDLAERLAVDGYRARTERFILVTVEAFDWNCPQHITPRFTATEVAGVVAGLHERIAELEAQLAERAPLPGR